MDETTEEKKDVTAAIYYPHPAMKKTHFAHVLKKIRRMIEISRPWELL